MRAFVGRFENGTYTTATKSDSFYLFPTWRSRWDRRRWRELRRRWEPGLRSPSAGVW